jgi:hypothetical protein
MVMGDWSGLREAVTERAEGAKYKILSHTMPLVGGIDDLGPCDTRTALYLAAQVYDLYLRDNKDKNQGYLSSDIEKYSMSDDSTFRTVFYLAVQCMFAHNRMSTEYNTAKYVMERDKDYSKEYAESLRGKVYNRVLGEGKLLRKAICPSGEGTALNPPYREPSDKPSQPEY